jgi:hypothetical protein
VGAGPTALAVRSGWSAGVIADASLTHGVLGYMAKSTAPPHRNFWDP